MWWRVATFSTRLFLLKFIAILFALNFSIMKKIILLLSFVFLANINAQTVDLKKALTMLPSELIYDLSKPQIDILFKTGVLKPYNNDANEAVIYRLEYIDNEKGDLKITMSFISGELGLFSKIELKAFPKSTGGYAVVYMTASGSPHLRPKAIYVYDYVDSKLIQNRSYGLKKELKVREFVQAGSGSDSILTICELHAHRCYNLTKSESGNIEYSLNSDLETSEMPWLKGNIILFKWSGEAFDKEVILR